jgi:antitoxin component of RelBE/YafQ-DinJ toxin-antitoxin module
VQTTLRIDDKIYREAKAEAARLGITLTHFIERALEFQLQQSADSLHQKDIQERNKMMEALLRRTARFRVDRKPTREEMNAR